jgi:hypothetical protein
MGINTWQANMARMKINVDHLPLIRRAGAAIMSNNGKTQPAIIIIMCFQFIVFFAFL